MNEVFASLSGSDVGADAFMYLQVEKKHAVLRIYTKG